MSTLTAIILATVLSGLVSVAFAGLVLWMPPAARLRVQPHLVSFATGALLGAALLGLLPHAIEGAGPEGAHDIGIALACGILVFFVLEKWVLWRHCHGPEECDTHTPHAHGPNHEARDRAAAYLVLAGDGFHNLLDGVLIAAAFLTDVRLGVVTALAVAAHEIPQEVGDFAILLHAGFSRAKALTLNLLTSLTSVIGAVIAYFALREVQPYLPIALAIAAASFIYVAVADLIPTLHRKLDVRTSIAQVVLIVLGLGVIGFAERSAHAEPGTSASRADEMRLSEPHSH